MRHAVKSSFVSSAKSSHSAPTSTATPSELTSDGSLSLATLIPNAKFFAASDVVFTEIADDVHTAQPGELVVFPIGDQEPTEFIAAALARGAAGILTEQILPCPLPQCVVGDVDLAIAGVNAKRLNRPDRRLLTIGVFGSAGKTTTALMVSQLLRNLGLRTSYQTGLGDCDGVVQSTASESVPAGGALVQWLGDCCDAGAKTAVIELSEQDAKHGRYDSIEFDLLVITGTPQDDDDFGPSGLNCVLDRMTGSGVVVVSADSPAVLRSVRDHGANAFTYGVRHAADVTAKLIEQECGMSTLLMTNESVTAVMETPLCGAAMASNHAAAAAIGILLNQPLQELVEHLGKLREIPGRMQVLSSFECADVIIDSANSPEQIGSALRAARSMKQPGGRLWCVMAIDPSDDPVKLALAGGHLERFADKPIVTCGAESKDLFLTGSHAVLDGVKDCALLRLVASDRRAIQWAIREASTRDTILWIGGIRQGGTRQGGAKQERQRVAQVTDWVVACKDAIAAESDRHPATKIETSVTNDNPMILSIFKK
ncbi:Mur ligase family protein [Novipirellula rosea]|uniref:Mur ligase family protein n=1 Tax=Novipirellula rosea TaxID=1031540 RepID=UPI0031ED18BC